LDYGPDIHGKTTVLAASLFPRQHEPLFAQLIYPKGYNVEISERKKKKIHSK